jgi:hypothetical protein
MNILKGKTIDRIRKLDQWLDRQVTKLLVILIVELLILDYLSWRHVL